MHVRLVAEGTGGRGTSVRNAAAEQNVQRRPGGRSRSIRGRPGRGREAARHAHHLAVVTVAQDRHRQVGIGIQRDRSAGAGKGDAREIGLPFGSHGQGEGE